MLQEPGILLLAVGSSFYGELAYNMAISLKLTNSSPTIAILTDGKALSTLTLQQKGVFDRIVLTSTREFMSEGKLNPYLVKVRLYELSPFEQTLYLDADGVFFNGFRELGDLWDQLERVDFHIQEEFRYDCRAAHEPNRYFWGDLKKIWRNMELPDKAVYVDYNSSFMWFRRTPALRRYFERAITVYDDARLEVKKVGHCFPDEVAWSIASAQLGIYSPVPNLRPIYYQNFSERRQEFHEFRTRGEFQDVVASHFFLGLPALPPTRSVIHFYNQWVQRNSRQAGDPAPFLFKPEEKLVHQTGAAPLRRSIHSP